MIREMSPQDLADENNELMQKIKHIEKKYERECQMSKMYKNLWQQSVNSIAEYESRISFYEHKHPNLCYEYEQFVEDNRQDS